MTIYNEFMNIIVFLENTVSGNQSSYDAFSLFLGQLFHSTSTFEHFNIYVYKFHFFFFFILQLVNLFVFYGTLCCIHAFVATQLFYKYFPNFKFLKSSNIVFPLFFLSVVVLFSCSLKIFLLFCMPCNLDLLIGMY